MNTNRPDYVHIPSVFPAVYRTLASKSKDKRAEFYIDKAQKRAEEKEATEKRVEEPERRCELEEAAVHLGERTQSEMKRKEFILYWSNHFALGKQ